MRQGTGREHWRRPLPRNLVRGVRTRFQSFDRRRTSEETLEPGSKTEPGSARFTRRVYSRTLAQALLDTPERGVDDRYDPYGMERPVMSDLLEFARRYTEAWCSGEPARVAEHYSPDGSLTINDASPAIGREAITDAAR